MMQGFGNRLHKMMDRFELMRDNPTPDKKHRKGASDCEKSKQIRGNPEDPCTHLPQCRIQTGVPFASKPSQSQFI
jgi:hypothetical protein